MEAGEGIPSAGIPRIVYPSGIREFQTILGAGSGIFSQKNGPGFDLNPGFSSTEQIHGKMGVWEELLPFSGDFPGKNSGWVPGISAAAEFPAVPKSGKIGNRFWLDSGSRIPPFPRDFFRDIAVGSGFGVTWARGN